MARLAVFISIGFWLALALPAAGQKAEWALPGLDGGELREGELANGATIVLVWAGWSPRCRRIVEQANQVVDDWGARARVVTVNFQEEKPDIRSFLEGKTLRAAVYLDVDGLFSKRHRVAKLPGLVVYRDGEVIYNGALPRDVDAALKSALDD